ncbi:hypothetical protein QOV31_004857 (plasmid) [Agrobacterium fabrum]|jgi:hypothetical protein|nr:hypothetical protein [Agrobacterium fabrum]CAD0216954.1 hypothetical protein AGTUEHA105_LOCUS4883 [Agrobacterium tumefaciens]WJK77973.1 hypothetical protein QOV31_004857 [Agrobacterium fabrum]CAH0270524.1 hypothetical protein SRABI46_03733 [Agrobacterium fabrum]CAH0279181.1 hypothetical protein SRABI05_03739 [Agrobacterium fabrum]
MRSGSGSGRQFEIPGKKGLVEIVPDILCRLRCYPFIPLAAILEMNSLCKHR